jgi:hypothetical protein
MKAVENKEEEKPVQGEYWDPLGIPHGLFMCPFA